MSEQRIRFAEIEGQRIAYATVGTGPPLIVPAPWLGNLQSDWENPEYRRFVEGLASDHQVIRYDRAGTGLSDRELPERPSLEHDVAVLEELIAHLGLRHVSLLGVSSGGCLAVGLAARNPGAVAAIAFAGSYLNGERLASPEVRESLVALIRANWGLGARMLTDIFVPDATRAERDEWVRFQRDAAEPDAAAEIFEFVYAYDVRHLASAVACPALVLHRRGDTAVSFELGRELAAALPNARLHPLEGTRHLPWHGDSAAIVAEVNAFLSEVRETEPQPTTPPPVARRGPLTLPELSPREVEVLRLVADGLSDREIAERLVLSQHTVHRHVANIRTKLGQPSRAAAAAHATRLELI